MDFVEVGTSGGVFQFAGRLAVDRARPCLLMVAGAFPDKNQHHELIGRFPDANVMVAVMPGWRGGFWSGCDARGLAKGLEEAAAFLFRDLPLVVCAGSASSMLGFSLKGPNVRRRIILEPFFNTAGLWPLINHSRRAMQRRPDNQDLRNRLWTVLGIGETVVEDRDFHWSVEDLQTPTDAVVGGAPLLPNDPARGFVSLTSVPDRQLLSLHPAVTLYVAEPEVGHDLWTDPKAARLIDGLMRHALDEAAAALPAR